MRSLRHLAIGSVASILLSLSPGRAETYRWVDKKGNVHYTDDPDQLPEPMRSKALEELERRLQKERERKTQLQRQGIEVPDERLPPEPSPQPLDNRPHPATQRIQGQRAAREQWRALAARARENVASLEKKCEDLKKERDRAGQDRLTYARPGAEQRYQETLDRHRRCQEDLDKARRYLEEELPEQARKNGIPPGWIR